MPVTNEPTLDDDRPAAAAAAAAAAEMTAAVTMTASAATTATSSPAGGMAPADPERLGPVLEVAYGQCDKITIFAKTFYQANKLMTEKQRKAVWAIYVWCRRTDDLVDGPRAMMNTDVMKADLAAWEERLRGLGGQAPRLARSLPLRHQAQGNFEMEIEPYPITDQRHGHGHARELGKNR